MASPIIGVRTHHGYFPPPPAGAPGEAFTQMVREATEEPFVGIAADGTIVPDVYRLEPSGVDNAAAVAAANAFLDCVDQMDYRLYVQQPVDHWQRRAWFNGSPLWMPEGVLIDDLRPEQREAALEMARHVLSPSGSAGSATPRPCRSTTASRARR